MKGEKNMVVVGIIWKKKKIKMALIIQVVQKAQYMIRLLNQEFENHVGAIHEGH